MFIRNGGNLSTSRMLTYGSPAIDVIAVPEVAGDRDGE
jgi:hypothetical protein